MLYNDANLQNLLNLLEEAKEIMNDQQQEFHDVRIEYLRCWLTLKNVYNQYDIKPTFKPSDKFIKE